MEWAGATAAGTEDGAETGTEAQGAGTSGAERDLRAWTPGRQRRALLELLRAGKTDLEIGERFALSQWQVRNLRYRLGIKKSRGGALRGRAAEPPTTRTGAEAGSLAVAVGDGARMDIRLHGRYPAAEAGQRLAALGGLVSASAGWVEVRVAVHQSPAGER